jgi:hypothetical protein
MIQRKSAKVKRQSHTSFPKADSALYFLSRQRNKTVEELIHVPPQVKALCLE